MFKRPRERLIFAKRRTKQSSKFSWVWAIVSIALCLVVLELLTRVVVDIRGDRVELVSNGAEPNLTKAYQLKFVNEKGEPYQTLTSGGSLVAERSFAVEYQLQENQDSQYWQINQQGFRDREPVEKIKPEAEVRIFLLGGATAFGYGSSSNENTIGEQLEARLQRRLQQQSDLPQLYQPDVLPTAADKRQAALAKPAKIAAKQYRVINAAVPGYASGNELAQLAIEILSYKPDVVILLDGYADLMLLSSEKATEIPQLEAYLESAPSYFRAYLHRFLEPVAEKSQLARTVRNQWLDPQKFQQNRDFYLNENFDRLVDYLPEDDAELAKRVERYYENHYQILKLCAAAQIPLVVATQPEITGQNPSQLTKTEGDIATRLGREYIQTVKNIYPQFVAANQKLANAFPKNVKAIDTYNLSDKYPSPSFIDPTHLTDEANQQVAEQLYYAVTTLPKLQVKPRQPATNN